jgi:hypothetical protein
MGFMQALIYSRETYCTTPRVFATLPAPLSLAPDGQQTLELHHVTFFPTDTLSPPAVVAWHLDLSCRFQEEGSFKELKKFN